MYIYPSQTRSSTPTHIYMNSWQKTYYLRYTHELIVLDPGEGVCAGPVNRGAILGKGGPDPQGGKKERQLSPGKGREKT